jgi:ligand-binding sensor protein
MDTHQTTVRDVWLPSDSDYNFGDSVAMTPLASHNPDQFIDLSRLQDILESISKIGRLSMVAVDNKGSFLTRPSGFRGFCRQAELNPLTNRCCHTAHEFGLAQAFSRGEHFSCFCPFGFFETTVPITDGQHLYGAVLLGQIRCGNAPPGLVDLGPAMAHEVIDGLNDPVLKAFHEAVPLKDFHELDELATMLARLGSWLIIPGPTNQQETFSRSSKTRKATTSPTNALNPHEPSNQALVNHRLNTAFLVNSVSSLANLAVIEGAWKTNRMAILLTDHLKNFHQGLINGFRPLVEELTDVERYLSMQELRYGDTLSFSLNSPRELGNTPIPTDILLAATERAICLGLSAGEEQLKILISVRRMGREIILEVSDNLTSVNPASEESLSSHFQDKSEISSIALRLESVKKQLSLCFGKTAELTIVPNKDGGTLYRVRLPLDSSKET